jgi:hypothetical protein
MGFTIHRVVVVFVFFGARTKELFFHFSGKSRTAFMVLNNCYITYGHVILTVDIFFSFPPEASRSYIERRAPCGSLS